MVVLPRARHDVDTFFMHMMDVDDLTAVAAGRAEESVRNIEISLVLDISGSMREGGKGLSRSPNSNAAKNSSHRSLEDEGRAEPRPRINVVPYAGQVNVGSGLLRAQYNARAHGTPTSNCLEVPASTYSTPTCRAPLAIPMSAYADMT